MSLFDKFINLINIFRVHSDDTEQEHEHTRFDDFLFFVDEADEEYENVEAAAELCNKALKIAQQRTVIDKKAKEYTVLLDEVACYENLNNDEADYLKDLVNKFVSLTKERNGLRLQMGDFDKSLYKLMELEQQAPEAIQRMEDAEIKRNIFKQDITYLKDEKQKLEEECENLKFGLKFIYYFSIGMTLLFGMGVMLLVLLNLFKEQVVFFPLTTLCIALLFLVSLIYVVKRKISFELKLNVKKQSKCVGLLNKKMVVFSYYQNFLNYEYKKFNVRSSAALRVNLKDYSHYKHITSRYDNIRNIMYQTQRILENFLREKHIKDVNASIESFAKTINIDDKIEYAKEISAKKRLLDEKIQELDDEHEAIWDALIRLNLQDKTSDKVIEKIIHAYLEEAGKENFDAENFDLDNFEESEELIS